jgi:hypothetical protein
MCGDKVLRTIRDYIVKENLTVKSALSIPQSISSDLIVSKEDLKHKIKKIAGKEVTYDEIIKAMDHFHKVSFEKKRERQVMNVEPG